jgi:hypothetical protein
MCYLKYGAVKRPRHHAGEYLIMSDLIVINNLFTNKVGIMIRQRKEKRKDDETSRERGVDVPKGRKNNIQTITWHIHTPKYSSY